MQRRQRRRRQRKRQKSNRFREAKQQLCTFITLFCTFLCRRCTTTTWNGPSSRFVEDGNKRPQLSFFFFWTLIQFFRIQLQKTLRGREGNGLSIWLTEDFCGFLQTRPVHFLKLCKFVILHLQTWHINERSTARWGLEIWTSGRQLLRSCSLWLSLEEPFQGSWIEVVDVLRKTQN